MSQYYNPQRSRNLYDAQADQPFRLSRSKLELFLECPRCFYLDRVLGVGRPPGFPFNLNSAVDTLLKKEFDIHRAAGTEHPLMKAYGVKAVPFQHEALDEWRENFVGIQFHHQPTNLIITGAVDDIWFNEQAELVVVDYKSTSKQAKITELDQEWQGGYKRQMEIYQWLLRHQGFPVSKTGYFVYCNGDTDRSAFDAKLEFDITLIAYEGDDSWIEKCIIDAHKCLQLKTIPTASANCDYCRYHQAISGKEKKS
ncbi:MAG: hypothetical protein UT42_C0021G0008 [Candidatus Falkowbacteria bacterium GW2011_GWA2_39_24]|uniref:PD-(D/E)XK endonuclease-like domain-containing protein n=1 Tax=Candidatus Falkowbacteria bacterium GW2011_GWA2_39_24 TaxID=1618634 RepID=A0A0G0NEY4_9BACT|nr:MAG: hypothetical protein UT42_C0021G0008 [Candidatus Falkowbacteria bacterium GW2011_GWA2_39_24]